MRKLEQLIRGKLLASSFANQRQSCLCRATSVRGLTKSSGSIIGKPIQPVRQAQYEEDTLPKPVEETAVERIEEAPIWKQPEPVKQEWISKIPVEFHGTLPNKFNNETQWLPIFRLPYLTRFRSVIRFKVYLTGISLGFCAYRMGDFIMGNFTFTGSQLLILSSFTLAGLIYMGDYFRRLVCQIYVTEDLQYIRVCRFTFFGNRRDLVLPVERVVPLPELNPSYRNPVFRIRFDMPDDIDLEHDDREFYENGLRLPVKYGGILDRDRFRLALGNVFARIGD